MKIAHELPNNRYKTKQELETALKLLGDLNRDKKKLEIEANEKIQAIQEKLAKAIEPFDAKINHVADGIKYYCDEHREQLFGTEKTLDLVTGTCAYRAGKPSVDGSGMKKLIQKVIDEAKLTKSVNAMQAKLMKLFLVLKISEDKALILKYPKMAKKLGYKIKKGDELLYVKPAQVDAEIEVAA